MALPASALVFSGRTALAVYPMLGAFTTTFGRNLPYRRSARVLAAAAVAMTMCVVCGAALAALTDPRAGGFGTVVVIAAMAVTAGLAKFLCDATRLSGLGAVLMLFSFAVAANGPAVSLSDVLAQTGLAATGAVTAWGLALVGWAVHPDRPQRLAVAVALRGLAGLLEPGGGADGTRHTRHRATAAVLQAYQSLGLSPLTTGRRRGERSTTCVLLADLTWSLLITSARRQTPDATTARYLHAQARLLTLRYRRLPSLLPQLTSLYPLCGDAATARPAEARIRDTMAQALDGFEDFNRRVRLPLGFRIKQPARELVFLTPSGRAEFSAAALPDVVPQDDMLVLQTMRSHDQWNTTIYSDDDRYRGIKNLRTLVLMNRADMRSRGITPGSLVDITATSKDGSKRSLTGYRALSYDMPRGCAAGYMPEMNALIGAADYSTQSAQPLMKNVKVRVAPSDSGTSSA